MKKLVGVFYVSFLFFSPHVAADRLRDLVGSFNGFIEDQYETNAKLSTHLLDPEKIEKQEKQMLNLKENMNTAKLISRETDRYLKGEVSPNLFLSELLEGRFEYLEKRLEMFNLARNEYATKGTMGMYTYLATNPRTLTDLKQLAEENSSDIARLNYQNAVFSIDRYQLYNKIIAEIVNRHDLSEFSVQTKEYLSASVTLHPLLTGESDDWSHPDFAILSYKEDPKGLQGKKDLDYYKGCIKEFETTVQFKGWAKDKGDKGGFCTIESDLASVGESALQLPYLAWVKPKKEKEQQKTILPVEQKSIELPPLIAPIEKEAPNQISIIEGLKVGKEEQTVEEEEEIVPPVAPEESYLAPQGIRRFHSKKAALTEMETISLPTIQQKTADDIFDLNSFKKVKFSQFESLWKHINGPSSIKAPGSGGSHRALLNREGKVVGSTFAHGANQTYTFKTIKYLRDALQEVGVRIPRPTHEK